MYSSSLGASLTLLSLLSSAYGAPFQSRSEDSTIKSCGSGSPAIYTVTSEALYTYGPKILPAGNTCNPSNKNCIPSTNVLEYANATIRRGASDLNLTTISLQNLHPPKNISTTPLPVAYNLNPNQAPATDFAVNAVVLTKYWNVTGTYQCAGPNAAAPLPFEVHFPLNDGVGLQAINYNSTLTSPPTSAASASTSATATPPPAAVPLDGKLVIADALISLCSVDPTAGDRQMIGGCYRVKLDPTQTE